MWLDDKLLYEQNKQTNKNIWCVRLLGLMFNTGGQLTNILECVAIEIQQVKKFLYSFVILGYLHTHDIYLLCI